MSRWTDDLHQTLASLRQKIRRYVLWEGLAVVLVLLAVWFWATYLLDVGYFTVSRLELPSRLRSFALIVGVAATAGLIVHWLVTRVLRPLRTSSLALLLERRYPALQGRLMTVVGSHASDDGVASAMLERTQRQAADTLRDVEVSDVLEPAPLYRWATAAAIGVASVLALGVTQPAGLSRWADAFLSVEDGYWDRFRQTGLTLATLRQPGERFVPFVDGRVRHPRGGNLTLLADVPEGKVVPNSVTLTVRSVSGDAIDQEVTMTAAGDRRFRHTVLNVAEDVRVDLVGGDFATARSYIVEAVPPPAVTDMRLECDYPDYTGLDEETNGVVDVRSAEVRLPAGTKFVLAGVTNKPVRSVRVRETDTGDILASSDDPDSPVSVEGSRIAISAEVNADDPSDDRLSLGEGLSLQLLLEDEDGLQSPRPTEITLRSEADRAPAIIARLSGVGTAVTKRARVPFAGSIEDDYGLAEAWFDVRRTALEGQPAAEPTRSPLDVTVAGRKDVTLEPDQAALELRSLSPEIGQSLQIAVSASDGDDLVGPNVGLGETVTLSIVSEDELLALLYDKELNLRGRFERIIEEIDETRVSLATGASRLRETADAESYNAASAAVEQGVLSVRKNAGETSAVVARFEDIRAELVNNRVDTSESLDRIDRGVLAPLRRILDREFAASETATVAARAAARERRSDTALAFDGAVDRLGRLSERLKAVLKEMQRRQSYNQLVKQLQQILERQRELKERTEEKSVDDFFDDLVP